MEKKSFYAQQAEFYERQVAFYEEVSQIIGMVHDTKVPNYYYRRSRWNNRHVGNGRFEGIGLIRYFGGVVQIAIRNPKVVITSLPPEEALALLREIFTTDE